MSAGQRLSLVHCPATATVVQLMQVGSQPGFYFAVGPWVWNWRTFEVIFNIMTRNVFTFYYLILKAESEQRIYH